MALEIWFFWKTYYDKYFWQKTTTIPHKNHKLLGVIGDSLKYF